MPRQRSKPAVGVGEVLIWILFAALLFPAGLVGWAVGHDTSSHPRTKTVTVTTSAAAATTTAPAPATTTAAAAPATTTAAAKPSANGKAIFISSGCGACHTFKPAGTSATVGPNLDTAPAADAKKTGTPLAAFVKKSILDPNAYIAPGFPKGIMPSNFSSRLSAAQLDALVSYITGGK